MVRALDPRSGGQLWSFSPNNSAAPGCTLDGSGTLYLGDARGALYALHSATGRLLWSYTVPPWNYAEYASITAGPSLGPGGLLYIQWTSNGAGLSALGERVWGYAVGWSS
jgi:outer membrane protein assembly factor BamB